MEDPFESKRNIPRSHSFTSNSRPSQLFIDQSKAPLEIEHGYSFFESSNSGFHEDKIEELGLYRNDSDILIPEDIHNSLNDQQRMQLISKTLTPLDIFQESEQYDSEKPHNLADNSPGQQIKSTHSSNESTSDDIKLGGPINYMTPSKEDKKSNVSSPNKASGQVFNRNY